MILGKLSPSLEEWKKENFDRFGHAGDTSPARGGLAIALTSLPVGTAICRIGQANHNRSGEREINMSVQMALCFASTKLHCPWN